MWEYKVVTGTYVVDGANVFLKNPAGEGAVQVVLDHYGGERWELVTASFDNVHREVVLVFKRPKGGASAVPQAAAAPAAAAAKAGPTFVDPEIGAIKRRSPAGGQAGGGRRSKADLDKLAGDD
ncbi:MAG TPA: hypothetical protein VFF73_16180 [Planctomycetota bacterium]|nr:hypothetical protein [Planctomycetota bacterium]